ncbi:uncharacterized protein LOC143551383 [Bidens hawaiensis]|uniref:uncharacterized protein LOC143551383 n=1 Tax=Bidens hawaiensis TaxID=980011 RepID=UPI0040491AFF
MSKRMLWDRLSDLVGGGDGFWVVCGDFNVVREASERRNSVFKGGCSRSFNGFIREANLREFEMRNFRFTCIREGGKKCSKLDRFLVSVDFFNKWPEACLRALSTCISDHRPIILSYKEVNFGPRPFRVLNSWTCRAGFEDVVNMAVDSFVFEGSSDLRLLAKLKWLRIHIKRWRDEMVVKEEEEKKVVREEMAILEECLEERDLEEDEVWTLARCKAVLKEHEGLKLQDLIQRSRLKWARDGDDNTKFFHSMVNCRKASNGIPGLNVNGVWVTKASLIKKEVFRFFRERFHEDLDNRPHLRCINCLRLSEEDSGFLVERFKTSEIKAAVFECGSDKAPGPDGFNFFFIKKFWGVFEEDFYAVFTDFFEDGKINIGCNSSFITLIPKKKDPLSLNDYRPISLVGVIAKVISKLLANRMKVVLDSVISDQQSAFIRGKSIIDGPLVINEVVSWCKLKKNKCFFLKIDFEKAYDNVNWDFVISILHQMNFPDRWCQWVRGLLSSARSAVLVNGSPTYEFKCSKGMRQGDPSSPFLFLVVMEALSCMIRAVCDEGLFCGIKLPNNGPVLSHLFYADDAMILGEWSIDNIKCVIRVLRCFYLCSGLKINVAKSSLFGVGVEDDEIGCMANVIGCRKGEFPFEYLGLKVGANMNRIVSWNPVVDIIHNRLDSWKVKTLSIGGRVTLIKSVLSSLPVYYMSLYVVPKAVIKKIDSLYKKFLWGGSVESKKIHWVAWERVAVPIKEGGLGICSTGVSSVALISKWLWRYKSENGLWKRVICAIHRSSVGWGGLPIGRLGNGVWANIAKQVNKLSVGNVPFRNFFKGEVRSGGAIQFWLDPWMTSVPLKDVYCNAFKVERFKNCLVSDRVIKGPNGLVFDWSWIDGERNSIVLDEIGSMEASITPMVFPDGEDYWRWVGGGSSGFSVGTVKNLIRAESGFRGSGSFRWCRWVPVRCNIFAWRAVLGKIPTVDALSYRKISVGRSICVLCEFGDESVEHIFTSCYVASIIWQAIASWCGINNFFAFSMDDLMEVHNYVGLKGYAKTAFQGIVIISCWRIWKARNECVFDRKIVRVGDLISEIKSLSFFWFSNRFDKYSLSWDSWCRFTFM